MVLLIATYFAVPATTGNTLSNANEDEFPPDDIMEDDLIETAKPEGVPARSFMGPKEVNLAQIARDLHDTYGPKGIV